MISFWFLKKHIEHRFNLLKKITDNSADGLRVQISTLSSSMCELQNRLAKLENRLNKHAELLSRLGTDDALEKVKRNSHGELPKKEIKTSGQSRNFVSRNGNIRSTDESAITASHPYSSHSTSGMENIGRPYENNNDLRHSHSNQHHQTHSQHHESCGFDSGGYDSGCSDSSYSSGGSGSFD
ncbi:TPA: hypothetical protein ACHOZC_003398 [Raoultella ornithinolytica]